MRRLPSAERSSGSAASPASTSSTSALTCSALARHRFRLIVDPKKANCAACHQANGKGVPGAFPALDGSKVVTGPKDGQIKTVLNGVVKNGQPTAMVPWRNTLSDIDIAAVITYTRNSWGNHTGEAIQPAEVKADRS